MSEIVDGQPVREAPVGTKQYEWSDAIPLAIRFDPSSRGYIVELAGVRIENHLAVDGLGFQFVDGAPVVTLTFAEHAIGLDLDAALISYLLEKAIVDSAPDEPYVVEPHQCEGC